MEEKPKLLQLAQNYYKEQNIENGKLDISHELKKLTEIETSTYKNNTTNLTQNEVRKEKTQAPEKKIITKEHRSSKIMANNSNKPSQPHSSNNRSVKKKINTSTFIERPTNKRGAEIC